MNLNYAAPHPSPANYSIFRVMEKPNLDGEIIGCSNERQIAKMENLHVAAERRTSSERERQNEREIANEERRTSSNKRQYAQWKMETLSAQVAL